MHFELFHGTVFKKFFTSQSTDFFSREFKSLVSHHFNTAMLYNCIMCIVCKRLRLLVVLIFFNK